MMKILIGYARPPPRSRHNEPIQLYVIVIIFGNFIIFVPLSRKFYELRNNICIDSILVFSFWQVICL